MLGAAMECPGGISAVVRCYRNHGVFDRWHVRYVSTFEAPGLRNQLTVMGKALWVIARMLLRKEVALVHAHSASRGSFWRKSVCCMLSHMFGVPYIFHIHSGEFSVFYARECGPLTKFWLRQTLQRAARVIALTEGWRNSFCKIAPNATIEVIGNPVNVTDSLPVTRAGTGRILFLGRLRETKGVFDLVRAIPIVLKRVPSAIFVLAGDGDSDSVRKLGESLGIASAIELPGWIDGAQKDTALAAADLLVLPSYFEGLPVCVQEAMANGVAVVATNVGGVPDVIETGVSGLLVTPGDIQGLGEAIVSLLTDDDLRERTRAAAFESVRKNFSVAETLRQLDRCYTSITGSVV